MSISEKVLDGDSNSLIIAGVDKGLDVFGSTVKTIVYFHLASKFNLDKKDIPRHPEKFLECLQSFFGPRAAIVEKCIVTSINRQFDVDVHADSLGLVEAITEARKQIGATIK